MTLKDTTSRTLGEKITAGLCGARERVLPLIFLLSISSVSIALGLLSFTDLSAQTSNTGALTVIAKDPTGRTIAGATALITNAAALNRKGVTSNDGSYTFGFLPPGTYNVKLSAPGFEPLEAPSVTVTVSETAVLDQAMKVGSDVQEVTVAADAENIQTESSTLGGVVDDRVVTAMPLVTRNYQQVLTLSAGSQASVSDGTALGRGSLPTFVNGNQDTSNSYQMDGISVNNYANSSVEEANSFYGSIPVISPDAIQEFKVQTSNYDAGYGRNSGAAVNIVTKSGTNNWHGDAFEFFRNDDLNANTFFQKRQGLPRSKLKQNQYGGVLGGPIKKDKLFFFFSYEGTRQINGVSAVSTSSVDFPSQLTSNRTAAALGAAFCPTNNPVGAPGATYAYTFSPTSGVTNPVTDQVACDGSNISPVALSLLNSKLPNGQLVIPTPQSILNAGTSQAIGFSVFSIPATFREDQGLFNLDYIISAKNSLALRYYFADGQSVAPFNTAAQPYSDGQQRLTGNQLVAGTLTTIISPNLLNQAHLSEYYIRARQSSLVPFNASAFGISSAQTFNLEVPVITITGLTGLFGNTVDAANNPQIAYQWSDQLSWNMGKHTFRFGFDESHIRWTFCSCGKSRGGLTFQSWADFLLGESSTQNGTAATTNLGNIFSVSASGQAFNDPNLGRENQIDGFAQDDYKVNSRLTFNMGVRWEYDGSPYDVNPLHGGTNVDYNLLATVPIPPSGGTLVGYSVAANYSGSVPTGVIRRKLNLLTYSHAPFGNFAPRVGFAWQPFGSSARAVVRGGYGIFYQLNDGQHYLDTLDSNPPLAASIGLSGTSAAQSTFTSPFGPPTTPNFSSFLRTTTTSLSYTAVDPYLITPSTGAWNLSVQYAIKPTLLAEIAYVGNRAEHIDTGETLNYPQLATPTVPLNCGLPTGCVTTNTTQNAAQRVPIIGAGIGGYRMTTNAGDSNYNAIQASLRKSYSRGLQLQASYTHGHCLTDVSGLSFTAGQGGSVSYDGALLSRQAAKGSCGFNRPQRINFNYVYELPGSHLHNLVAQKTLGGWSLSGITVFQDGLPMTITDSKLAGVYGFVASGAQTCPGVTVATMKTPGPVAANLNHYLNAKSFADTSATAGSASCPAPIVGAFASPGGGLPASPGATGYGNLGQNILIGPGQFNWDMSMAKNIKVGGVRHKAELEFRAELFNVFNHPQFSNPSTLVASSNAFGQITSTSTGPRIAQFALKYVY